MAVVVVVLEFATGGDDDFRGCLRFGPFESNMEETSLKRLVLELGMTGKLIRGRLKLDTAGT